MLLTGQPPYLGLHLLLPCQAQLPREPRLVSQQMLLVLPLLPNNLSVLTVLDQTQPPASVLMVHNHNHSLRLLMPQPPILLPNNLSVLTVLDQTQPPASVLMVHNHNHSL